MKRFWIMVAAVAGAGPAAAHHPLAGAPMETLWHGLASGVGHPVLGFDHLFFVVAVGLAAGMMGRPLRAPLAYVVAMGLGCVLAAQGAALPLVEVGVAASLVALGLAVATGRVRHALWVFAAFGIFHGAAFAGALTGVEATAAPPVLLGYLVGLAAVQWAIACAVALCVRKPQAIAIGGAMVAGVGVFLILEAVEGPMVAALIG